MYDCGMCEGLSEAIDDYDIPVDGDALAEAFALADRLQAKLAEAVAAFDRAELWDIESATSMTAWLRDRAGLTGRRARHTTAIARRLGSLPVTAAAWRAGELSGGQVEAIAAGVDDTTIDVFAAHEAELVPTLAGLSTVDTVRAMAVWKAHATADGAEPDDADRAAAPVPHPGWHRRHRRHPHPRGVRGREHRPAAGRPPRSRRRPGTHPRPAAPRRPGRCVPLVSRPPTDPAGWAAPTPPQCHRHPRRPQRRPGRPHRRRAALDGATISRLVCDSALHRVLMAGRSTILDYGTATRTTPVNLWNALVVRDEGCRWPGCDRPSDWCQAHHVRWVTNGGPTRPDNLALLCSRHHHRAHQPGWHVKLHADATLVVTDPNGRTRTTRPPGTLRPMVA